MSMTTKTEALTASPAPWARWRRSHSLKRQFCSFRPPRHQLPNEHDWQEISLSRDRRRAKDLELVFQCSLVLLKDSKKSAHIFPSCLLQFSKYFPNRPLRSGYLKYTITTLWIAILASKLFQTSKLFCNNRLRLTVCEDMCGNQN